MKNISKILLLSTSCLIWYGADNVCASVNVFSGIPKSGTHITHYTHYLAEPHLSSVQSDNRQRHLRTHSQSDATTFGDPGGNLEALFDLDCRIKSDNDVRVASVCFITDAGNCSGEKFSNDETPGNGNGNPGGVPDYDTPQEQCQAAGYGVTSCPAGSHGDNACPADSAYYQKCVCDANMTQTCTKPYYGVGPSCDGKYASCKRDEAKACKEDGFSQTAQCSSVQTPNKKCSYNSSYYDKCVCRSDLVTCSYPQTGVGSSCNGKYASCQCPSSYKSCECGGAVGATSCTVNGQTTYSNCKECHTHSYACPSGYQSSNCGSGYTQTGTASKTCSCGVTSGSCYKCSYNSSSGGNSGGPESGSGNSNKDEPKAILGQCTGYAQNCKIGNILNSDGTCTADKVTGKTPIGVVVAIKDNCGYAMTAIPIQTKIKWGGHGTDIPSLPNYTNWQAAITDFDVSRNMTKIIQAGNANTYPAAYAAFNYAPSAAPTTKGLWMLPSAGILHTLYTNKNMINNTISKLGGIQLTNDNEHIWSSSEYNDTLVWAFWTFSPIQEGVGGYDKNNIDACIISECIPFVVRPVIMF